MRSAVIVPVALPARLAAVRNAHDLMAARGVPAHVTILFPFLPSDALTEDVRSTLARIAGGRRRFVARFEHAGRPDGRVWILPGDQRPFLDLTAAVAACWPDYPPYEGIHDELIAHLTLVESADDGARDAAWLAATDAGGFEAAVDEVTVITEDAAGGWHLRWSLPLGTAGSGPAPGGDTRTASGTMPGPAEPPAQSSVVRSEQRGRSG